MRNRDEHRIRGAAAWLHLAATPAFAAMALLTVFADNAAGMLCSAHGMSPLTGMPTMYLLMSAFHAGPWLRMLAARTYKQGSAARAAVPD